MGAGKPGGGEGKEDPSEGLPCSHVLKLACLISFFSKGWAPRKLGLRLHLCTYPW